MVIGLLQEPCFEAFDGLVLLFQRKRICLIGISHFSETLFLPLGSDATPMTEDLITGVRGRKMQQLHDVEAIDARLPCRTEERHQT